MNSYKPLFWISAERTHVGKVRKINEDACLSKPEFGLWAVADGMGGHEAGDVASRTIVEKLSAMPQPRDFSSYLAAAHQALHNANQQLRQESIRRYHRRTIGSTVVVLLTYQDRGACLWVGDSRIYRLRGNELTQLTRDHSHVQDLVDKGLLDARAAQNHPMANVITRAIGSSDELDIDELPINLQPGDVYLLCSDGLNKMVSDEEIAKELSQYNSQSTALSLEHMALSRGAHDNVTTVVVNISEKNVEPDWDEKTRPIRDMSSFPR